MEWVIRYSCSTASEIVLHLQSLIPCNCPSEKKQTKQPLFLHNITTEVAAFVPVIYNVFDFFRQEVGASVCLLDCAHQVSKCWTFAIGIHCCPLRNKGECLYVTLLGIFMSVPCINSIKTLFYYSFLHHVQHTCTRGWYAAMALIMSVTTST